MSARELVPLDSVPSSPVQWLWRGRIPLGGITLLDGDPGDGKSTVMYDLAARVTAGRPMPHEETSFEPAGVVLLQAEDSVATTIRPFIEAAEGDLSKVLVYDRTVFANRPFLLPHDTEIIVEAIQAVEAKLVVIDPFAAFLAGSSNSESTIRKALSGLSVIAETHDVAIVIVRHLTKGRSGNTKYRGSGSIGIIGAARSALMVADDPNSNDPHQHVLALNKSNLSDASSLVYRTCKQGQTTVVRWMGESSHGVRQLSESAANHFEHSQLEEACYVLYTILADTEEPVAAKEVQQRAKEALVSQRTLMRAKKKMGVTSRRVAEDENVRWVWELPKNRSTLASYEERSVQEEISVSLERVEDDPPELCYAEGESISEPAFKYGVVATNDEDETQEMCDADESRQWHD